MNEARRQNYSVQKIRWDQSQNATHLVDYRERIAEVKEYIYIHTYIEIYARNSNNII